MRVCSYFVGCKTRLLTAALRYVGLIPSDWCVLCVFVCFCTTCGWVRTAPAIPLPRTHNTHRMYAQTTLAQTHRAFYEAGMAWRAAGRPSMAFVLLNRYLDIADAIDEGGQAPLEGADLVGTDIPRDAVLPSKHYCDERAREEVRCCVGQLTLTTVWSSSTAALQPKRHPTRFPHTHM